jgi:hypothetical protein
VYLELGAKQNSTERFGKCSLAGKGAVEKGTVAKEIATVKKKQALYAHMNNKRKMKKIK